MKVKHYILAVAAIVLTACATDSPALTGDEPLPATDDNAVLFSAGSESGSRAVPYMGENGRFVCRMYYISSQLGSEYAAEPIESWLKVNNTVGNSVYRKGDFAVEENLTPGTPEYEAVFDKYGFQKVAQIFYWQNRKNHAFFAYTDLNRAFSTEYKNGNNRSDLCFEDPVEPYVLKEMVGEEEKEFKGRVHDLRTTGKASMTEQPDPAQALTVMSPAGATQEANRVPLVFSHCFSQVVVNVKVGATSGITESLAAEHITRIEMLGVAEEAYTYYELDLTNATYHEPTHKLIDLSKYPEDQLQDNPYGTSIAMFARSPQDCPPGYLKSFNAIAFGNLNALRIHWKEPGETPIEHITTFVVKDNNFVALKSGTRYIYNIELRRGTLAVIRPEMLPWDIDETVNNGDGILKEPSIVNNAAALAQAITDGAYDIILGSDIDLESQLEIPQGSSLTIDLNGNTIKNTKNLGAALYVAGNLTITGNGTVEGGSGGNNKAVEVIAGAKCSIMNGTFHVGGDANDEGNDCIYCNGGEVEIYGGNFSSEKPYRERYYVLNQKNSTPGTITVYGGRFENYDPATGDDNLGGNFVAEGYESVLVSGAEATPKVYEVRKKTE